MTPAKLTAKKLLLPGWGGTLTPEELEWIQQALLRDPILARAWGFRPSQKTRSAEAIQRVAMWGDPANEDHNRKLARPRKHSP